MLLRYLLACARPGDLDGTPNENETPDWLVSGQKKLGNVKDLILGRSRHAGQGVYEAVKANDATLARDIFADSSDMLLKRHGPKRDTLLHVAAREGSVLVLDLILRRLRAMQDTGMVEPYTTALMVNAYHHSRKTALGLACEAGHADCVKLLLTYGADPVRVFREGNTALHVAAERGHVDCLAALLGQESYLIDHNWRDAGDVRVRGRRLADIANYKGVSPLHLAALFGHLESVRVLLSHGAKTHFLTVSSVPHPAVPAGTACSSRLRLAASSSVLHAAVLSGSLPTARALLQSVVEGLGTRRWQDSGVNGYAVRRELGVDLRNQLNWFGERAADVARSQGNTEMQEAVAPGLPIEELLFGYEIQVRTVGTPSLAALCMGVHREHLLSSLDAAITCKLTGGELLLPDGGLPKLPEAVESCDGLEEDVGGSERSFTSEGSTAALQPLSPSCHPTSVHMLVAEGSFTDCGRDDCSPVDVSGFILHDNSSFVPEALVPGEVAVCCSDGTKAEDPGLPASPRPHTCEEACSDVPERPGKGPGVVGIPAEATGNIPTSRQYQGTHTECQICFDADASIGLAPCEHAFCPDCVRSVVHQDTHYAPLCPFCRCSIAGLHLVDANQA